MPSSGTTKYETLNKTGKLGNEPDELNEHECYVDTVDPDVQVIEDIDIERKATHKKYEGFKALR